METHNKIRNYIAQNLLFSDNGFEYDDDVSLLDEGIVDSMGVLELVLYLEETFGISVEDQDVTPDNFDSINKIVGYLHRKMEVIGQ